MRRFITSLTGKLIGQLLIVALIMPSLTLMLAGRAYAQVQVLPSWAVVEFRNAKSAGTTFGSDAAEAVSNELGKTGKYDVRAAETTKRTIETLGLVSPVTGSTNLVRLGTEMQVSTIVTGEIVDYIVGSANGGRQARVTVRVIVYDVASGLAVNGAALAADSTVRAGNVDDATLIKDAIASAAVQAVREIESKTLPTATIMNTLGGEALINQGARSGFKVGQDVIIIRGREQVATAKVFDVEPDSAQVRVERSSKGLRPGDRVRAVASVPNIGTFRPNGQPRIIRDRKPAANSGLVTTLLVLGLVALLLGNGNSNSQSSVTQVSAEPLLFPDASGSPAVRISWTPNGFAKGNAQKALWQIWRDDIIGSPVLVVPGIQGSAIDTTAARAVSYADFGRVVGGTTCDNEDSTDTDVTAVAGVVPGRPYLYRVELVYGLSSIDLPDGGTGGSGTGGGTTGGGNTGGGNTGGGNTGGGNTGGGNTGGGNTGGGNTGGGGGGSAATCYFLSDQTVAQGVATPLDRVQLNTPASNATVSAPINFTFNSVANPIFPTNMEYVVQFSTQPTFPQAQTYTVTSFVSNATGILSTPTIDTLGPNIPANIRNAQEVYWRIGARNVNDRPGPVPDASGQRYVFGAGRKFTRPAPPPNPPL